MKTTVKKSLAIILALLMMISAGAAGITAFAADPSIGTVSVEAKFFRFDADLGDWVETDKAKKGETVKTRIYVDTDYFTNSGQLMVFYEDEFFTDSYERSKILETYSSTYYQDLCGMTAQLTFYDKSSKAIDRFIANGIFDEEFAQTHTCVSIMYLFSFSSTNKKLSGNEWLVEFELTVKENTSLTEGSVFTTASAFQSPDRERSFSDIPYGEEGKEYYENDSLYTVYVDIETKVNSVSTEGNIILDANGGYFDGYEQEYCVSQEIGTEFRSIEAPEPEKDGFNLVGWTYENGNDATTDIITVGYEDIKLYAQWEEEVYFYELSFNANGGKFEGGSDIYAGFYEAGTDVILADYAVTRDGYIFAGWLDEDGNKVDSFTMPARDITLTASWIPVTAYTVTFYLDEDGTEIYLEKIYAEGESLVYPAPPSIPGYEFDSWSEPEGTEITEDLEVYPCYTVAEYYVSIYGVYGDVIDSWVAYYGDEITLGYLLSADDMNAMLADNGDYYTFDFWSYNGVEMDESTVITVTQDVEIDGVFTAMDAVLKFDANGGAFADGSGIFEVTLKYDEEIAEDMYPALPTREGYEFMAWSLDLTGLPMDELEKTVRATWVKKTYSVNYVVDGNVAATVNCEYGTVIDSIVTPDASAIPAGYTFIGWSLDESATAPEELGTVGAGEVNVYAVLKANSGITYSAEIYKENFSGEYELAETLTFSDGTTGENAPYTAENLEGFTFNAATSVVDLPVAGDGSTVLIVYYNRNVYTLSTYSDGESVGNYSYYYGETVEEPAHPKKVGYTFEYWYDEATGKEFTFPCNMPARDLELKASWSINSYTVTFETGTDEVIDAETHSFGSTIELPVLERTGYIFEGWDFNGTVINGSLDIPDSDVNLVAVWTPSTDTRYTVEYYYGSADGYSYDLVTKEFTGTTGAEITVMPEGVEGFTFDIHSSVIKGVIAPDGSSVFELRYERNAYDFITYDGGATLVADSYLFETTVSGTDTPSKVGHTFDRWVYRGTDETVVFPFDMPAKNIEIEAVWVVNSYTVSFNADGGTEVSSSSHKFGEDYTLPSTTKSGYSLSGWMDSDGNMYAAGEVIKIPANNVEFTAVWVINNRKVTYVIGKETVVIDVAAGLAIPLPDMSGMTNAEVICWLDENGNETTIPDVMPEADLIFKAKLRYSFGDNPYGVTAEYDDGSFSCDGSELEFEVEKKEFEKENGGLNIGGKNYKQLYVYDVSFNLGGAEVQPESGKKIKIAVPVPAAFKDGTSFIVINRFGDGEYEQIPVTKSGDMLVFEVSRLGELEICVKSETSILTLPAKLNYIYKEALNLSGLTLEVVDENGNKTVVSDTDAMTVNGYNPKKIGTQTLTVEFDGTSAQFNVTVKYAWWQWIIRIFLLGFLWY